MYVAVLYLYMERRAKTQPLIQVYPAKEADVRQTSRRQNTPEAGDTLTRDIANAIVFLKDLQMFSHFHSYYDE